MYVSLGLVKSDSELLVKSRGASDLEWGVLSLSCETSLCAELKLRAVKNKKEDLAQRTVLNVPLFISSAVFFIRKERPLHSSLEISRSDHRYVQSE